MTRIYLIILASPTGEFYYVLDEDYWEMFDHDAPYLDQIDEGNCYATFEDKEELYAYLDEHNFTVTETARGDFA